ncbi:transketolase [Mycobacterium sp. M26]|uniref:transketolase n=1 Tax=Mycobacterium sp. M26 TaxID=1762962 RepID=UPI00073EA3D4|nr:transketolase [Mycobacterium sp. M26]
MTSTSQRARRTTEELRRRADWIRRKTIDLVEVAGSGHYSSTFSCAEILAVLYDAVLDLRPGEPDWPDRDRFLLGKGHVAVGLYPLLAELEYFPAEWLDSYTRLGSPLGDHPDMNKVPGIDFSSGSIGHNLSVGLGMALGGRMRDATYRTFVLIGDGELHEGQVWEAAMAAAHHQAAGLIAIVDANGWTLDGPVGEVLGIEPIGAKFTAFGWNVEEVDGHDVEQLRAALSPARGGHGAPTVIIARTLKGKGVSFMEGDAGWHLGYLGEADRQRAISELESK